MRDQNPGFLEPGCAATSASAGTALTSAAGGDALGGAVAVVPTGVGRSPETTGPVSTWLGLPPAIWSIHEPD